LIIICKFFFWVTFVMKFFFLREIADLWWAFFTLISEEPKHYFFWNGYRISLETVLILHKKLNILFWIFLP
jgi:hypothetical protein